MMFLIYILTAIVVFLGCFAGYFLSRTTFEENSYVAKYLLLLNVLLVPLIIFFLLFRFSLFYSLLAGVFTLIIAVVFRKTVQNITHIVYALFGVVFYISSLNQDSFIIISSALFLYSISITSLVSYKFYIGKKINIKNYEKKLKQKKISNELILIIFKKYIYFLVVSVLCYFIF